MIRFAVLVKKRWCMPFGKVAQAGFEHGIRIRSYGPCSALSLLIDCAQNGLRAIGDRIGVVASQLSSFIDRDLQNEVRVLLFILNHRENT